MEIKLSSKTYGDFSAFIDDKDYGLVKDINWMVCKGKGDIIYARGRVKDRDRHKYNCQSVRMHRVIMNAKVGEMVDHKDHDGLNNRRSNLRIATQSQNSMNMRGCINATGFKGVAYRKSKDLYIARIRINGVLIGGGMFKNKYEAALKYNEMAKKHFGKYAHLNKLTKEELALAKIKAPLAKYNTNTTGYRGVCITKNTSNKIYAATIRVDGKNKYLGCFDNPLDAAKAYNEGVITYNKPLAFLNKIPNE